MKEIEIRRKIMGLKRVLAILVTIILFVALSFDFFF